MKNNKAKIEIKPSSILDEDLFTLDGACYSLDGDCFSELSDSDGGQTNDKGCTTTETEDEG